MHLDAVFTRDGLATRADLLAVMNPKTLTRHVHAGRIVRVWQGVYAPAEPDLRTRLTGLELMTGRRIVGCMHTAAELYGFATTDTDRVHILDPGVRMRPSSNLVVHQRFGAPLQPFEGQLLTAPAWTAVEVARNQRRGCALATLDAVLRTGRADDAALQSAVTEQRGRRGIVQVRELLSLADPRAESAMESQARLVMIDGGLPAPELQYEIIDRYGKLWRADFAWPEYKVIAEYESIAFHSGPEEMLRDRRRVARLQECGWIVIPIVVGDLFSGRPMLLSRLRFHLFGSARTG